MDKHAVVLGNLGGPESLEEVKPFLKSLFMDADIFNFPFGKVGQNIFSSLIAHLRAPTSRKLYEAIGGKSPIIKNTQLQADALEEILSSEGNYKVFTTHRYSKPTLAETIKELKSENYSSVTVIPLFPQYSTTTTLSLINEWERRGGNEIDNVRFIERFYDNKGYLDACIENIREKLETFLSKPYILFSAHSIPVSRVDAGDPYRDEIEKTMHLIIAGLKKTYNSGLSYQSKVGPIKWIGPSVSEALKKLSDDSVKNILLVPLSFVSEHLETLYELDIEYKNEAVSLGFERFERADTPGINTHFISGLKSLITGDRK